MSILLGPPPKGKKSRYKQMELYQTKKSILHIKENYQQNKKATCRIQEDICD